MCLLGGSVASWLHLRRLQERRRGDGQRAAHQWRVAVAEMAWRRREAHRRGWCGEAWSRVQHPPPLCGALSSISSFFLSSGTPSSSFPLQDGQRVGENSNLRLGLGAGPRGVFYGWRLGFGTGMDGNNEGQAAWWQSGWASAKVMRSGAVMSPCARRCPRSRAARGGGRCTVRRG